MNFATMAAEARYSFVSRKEIITALAALETLGWAKTDPRYLELEAALIAARIRVERAERQRS